MPLACGPDRDACYHRRSTSFEKNMYDAGGDPSQYYLNLVCCFFLDIFSFRRLFKRTLV